jgi:hypothetical protein
MRYRKSVILLLAVVFVLGSLAVMAVAQEERQSREQESDRRRLSDEERVERYVSTLKEELAPTEQEWKILEPKLKALINTRVELRRLSFARLRDLQGFYGGRRFGQPQEEEADTPESQLRELLMDKSSKDESIWATLEAVRAARVEESRKSRERMRELHRQLSEQQDELKELLSSIKQEAVLVLRGVIS